MSLHRICMYSLLFSIFHIKLVVVLKYLYWLFLVIDITLTKKFRKKLKDTKGSIYLHELVWNWINIGKIQLQEANLLTG